MRTPMELLQSKRVMVEESRSERAAHAICLAVSDFTLAISDAQTPAAARDIYAMLGPLLSLLESTERKALDKAEELAR